MLYISDFYLQYKNLKTRKKKGKYMRIVKDKINIINIKANQLVKEFEINGKKKRKYAKGAIPFSLFSLYNQEVLYDKIKYNFLSSTFTL